MTVSDNTKTLIKRRHEESVRLILYYARMGTRYSRRHNVSQFILLIASLGATTSALGVFANWITVELPTLTVILNLVVAITAAISITWNNSAKIAQLYSTSAKCRNIGLQLEELQARIGQIDDSVALSELFKLATYLEEVSAPIETAGIGVNRRMNRMAQNDAKRMSNTHLNENERETSVPSTGTSASQ